MVYENKISQRKCAMSVPTLWGVGRERVWGLCWDGAGAGGIGCGYGYGYGYGYGVGYLCPSVQGIY